MGADSKEYLVLRTPEALEAWKALVEAGLLEMLPTTEAKDKLYWSSCTFTFRGEPMAVELSLREGFWFVYVGETSFAVPDQKVMERFVKGLPEMRKARIEKHYQEELKRLRWW